MTDEAVGQPQTPNARRRDNRNLSATQRKVTCYHALITRIETQTPIHCEAYRWAGTRLEEKGEEVGELERLGHLIAR